ncbi:MAG: hypothetical protein RBU30_21405 [Polyangia bacterium]|jgi:D-alanine-D-alanine ligase|nr:hypothetical protein [Polyangia bacterium]
MDDHLRRTDLSVAVLHDLDPAWTLEEQEETRAQVGAMVKALEALGHPVQCLPVRSPDMDAVLDQIDPARTVVLNWVEELPGAERGCVDAAKAYESRGLVYTGATPEVLDLSYDKPRWKTLLREAGVPTPWEGYFESPETDNWELFPAIVKPAYAHCSTGIDRDAVVLDSASLKQRVAWLLQEVGQPAMVEPFVDGREFHVSLWGNGKIEMLPPAEMDFSALSSLQDRLCSYDSKFTPGSEDFETITVRLPAPLEPGELAMLEQVCLQAYRVLGCRDYARMDVRQKDGVYYVLDVNPNPDMTVDTSFALAAKLQGTSYGELGSYLVNLAALRLTA